MSEKHSPPLEPGDPYLFENATQFRRNADSSNDTRNTSLALIFDAINLTQYREGQGFGPSKKKLKGPVIEAQSKESENLISHGSDYSGKLPSDFSHSEPSSEDSENSAGQTGQDDEKEEDEEDEEKEDIDWDEAIDDDDIRYTLAADKAVEYILDARANSIKPGYESFKKLVDYAESLKLILILLISVFTILARPAWCANLGSKINWECTKSQDPDNQVEYLKSGLPVLSAATKRVILILCMFGISMLNLMKIMICKGDNIQRISFYFCLGSLFCYSIGFYLLEFGILKIGFLDIFALLYVIFGIKVLQKTMIKFVVVLIDAKEVLVFFMLFIVTTALIARLSPDFWFSLRTFKLS